MARVSDASGKQFPLVHDEGWDLRLTLVKGRMPHAYPYSGFDDVYSTHERASGASQRLGSGKPLTGLSRASK
jgi:hypothetical protein